MYELDGVEDVTSEDDDNIYEDYGCIEEVVLSESDSFEGRYDALFDVDKKKRHRGLNVPFPELSLNDMDSDDLEKVLLGGDV